VHLVVASPLSEAVTGRLPVDDPVLNGQTEHLREAGLAGPEEARHPDGDAFVWLVRRLPVRVEDACVVTANGIGDDVLVDLVENALFVGLIDLDDLLDAPTDVVSEEGPDGLSCHWKDPYQKIFGR
jgi:hypothetical protein